MKATTTRRYALRLAYKKRRPKNFLSYIIKIRRRKRNNPSKANKMYTDFPNKGKPIKLSSDKRAGLPQSGDNKNLSYVKKWERQRLK